MKALDDLLAASQEESDVFHPVRSTAPDVWFPGNEPASLAVQCSHIWDDILCLIQIRSNTKDDYGRQLLLKHVIIEVRSLVEVFDRLQAFVMKAEVQVPEASNPWRGLTVIERERAKALYKTYSQAKALCERSIISIRDNIGAHRSNVDWEQVKLFWSKVSVETVAPLLEVIPRVFEFVKELNIYEWNRTFLDGTITLLGSKIHPESLHRAPSRVSTLGINDSAP